MTIHELLLKAMEERAKGGVKGPSFGTADFYVKQMEPVLASGLCRAMGGVNMAAAIKHASMVLTVQSELIKADSDEGRMEIELPTGIELPEKTLMLLQHKLTSPKVDRDKDILRTEGASLDPKAPLLWQHMHPLPVGKVLTTLEHTKDILRVASVLLDLNDLTRDIETLVKADVLRFSHGFRALEYNERKAEDGQMSGWNGFEITKFEIMEASLVSVPSNTDAEMELWSGGKLASDFFKAKAKLQWDGRTKQAPGFTLPKRDDDKQPKQKGEQDDTSKAATSKEATTDTKPEGEKAGAKLSAKYKEMLNEVRMDLEELDTKEELSRGGRAICKRCRKTLDEMLNDGGDGADGEESPKSAEPQVITKTVEVVKAPSVQQARAILLIASRDERAAVLNDLQLMEAVDKANDAVEVVRQMIPV